MAKTNAYADYFKFFGDIKVPGIDFNALFAMQRRNIEAFSSANQTVTEGYQALARRNVEIVKANIQELLGATRELLTASSPEQSASKQAAYAKAAFERTLSYTKELAEMASKSNLEALDVLNKRVVESLEELGRVTKAAA